MHSFFSHRAIAAVLLSVSVLLFFVLLTGANHAPQVGRYRMAVVTRNSFADVYVIDTVTGIVKYLGKDEGKPFEAVSGK